MTLSNKTPGVQTYRLLMYQRALHPELFTIESRRTITQPDYEMESWLIPGGHVLRFQVGGLCVSEAVVDHEHDLPDRGLNQTLPCLGEKELDEKVGGVIRHVASVQTEMLSDNLYAATYQEMKDFAEEAGAMHCQWSDPEGARNLSLVDVQRYRSEAHAQCYHLIGSAGFVLRTQSIFELA